MIPAVLLVLLARGDGSWMGAVLAAVLRLLDAGGWLS